MDHCHLSDGIYILTHEGDRILQILLFGDIRFESQSHNGGFYCLNPGNWIPGTGWVFATIGDAMYLTNITYLILAIKRYGVLFDNSPTGGITCSTDNHVYYVYWINATLIHL